jgi:hypothetical protein
MVSRLSAEPDASRVPVLRLNVHGQAVDVRCSLPGLRQVLLDLLRGLIVHDLPDGFQPIDARIDPYDDNTVARMVSSKARRIGTGDGLAELWGDGERFWMLDERWGICEINLLRRSWRACLLTRALNEPIRTIDHVLFWPLSQLLIRHDLLIVPGASVTHRGRGVLLLAPFDLEPELHVFARSGQSVVSQRWSAARFDEARPLLLQLPGRVERAAAPRRGLAHGAMGCSWYDLASLFGTRPYAWCDAVVIVEPARRSTGSIRRLRGTSACTALRAAWPVQEIVPGHTTGRLLSLLAQQACIYRAELSRDPTQLLTMLAQTEQTPREPAPEALVA